ncbi:4-hydroxythreonine-4-phosphate dehydrogenase PdxA [Roseospira marina]|uniref:4-hydroxythreonine-4-phosphate dehydrogenase PdxA n=1 Tax=Roseospira marina TaxID=140057 RepID=A0A5M6I8Q5_9PROT|nr:4-hydroxythreonine-4-phosphate dehydrogenase PdxA [Roseospira marina]KAA5604195.1 4-hydroxythreonine-4-phosphate dehydrogenase PdxA [Roseospira marina]MBB4315708.1 4-hydroxythreonine-4-phosphate dehydrogenase [Roseospira marina]MBB5088820.1 4-hydroxythreonine-4-phosphate dehydrogenase [Roseospira marina]
MTPVIGITMGDVCGIGPEIIAKSLMDPKVYALSQPVVIGDAAALERARDLVGTDFAVRRMAPDAIDLAGTSPKLVACVDPGLEVGALPYGDVRAEAGHAAYEFVRVAVELAQAGTIRAIVTAPLNKEALHKGGHLFAGHTEILADLTGTTDYSMMLATPKLKVIHLTTHVGMIEAVRRINPERTYQVIKLAHDTVMRAGLGAPRIAVCGINPHAGEHGLFGENEEETKLEPGIARAKQDGINVSGPWPGDTIFFRAMRGDFDVVVACYHDQGHIPVKLMSIDDGVNITVGLKGGIIRTSVDHGTAFDIAGQAIARHDSLVTALQLAVDLAPKTVSA